MADHLIFEMLVIAAASFVVVAALVRLSFSPIIGYLAAGLLVGPHGFNLLGATEGIRFLGELGVALLMFIVGLEFSLPRLIAARTVVFGLGGLQVVATTALAATVAWLAGAGWVAALVLGAAAAMSSTAIAAKQLSDQGELNSRHGRIALGILLFQDLATLPALVVVDALHGRGGEADTLQAVTRSAVAVVLFVATALLARRALARAIEWVAGTRSNELFQLATLLLILASAHAAHVAGLSLPIAAFLAGMLVGESDFRHQVEDEIRPFRDVLLGLFFLTVGMSLDPGAITASPLLVLGAVLLLVGSKALIVFAVARIAGWAAAPALRAGLVLAHGGEFALLIVAQALAAGLLDAAAGQLVLVAVALSMVVAPLLIQRSGQIAALLGWAEARARIDEAAIAESCAGLSGHVVLCGYGRVGRLVAAALRASAVPYVVIERDVERLRLAQEHGHRAVFGDATRLSILRAVGVERARIVATTLPEHPTGRLLRRLRIAAPRVPAIVSTDDAVGLRPLIEAGASRILPENLAAGLALAEEVLLALGLPTGEIAARITEVRTGLNPELRGLPRPAAEDAAAPP
ncbi:cation:proton antiporter [Falsiroseomonas sp. HC035]|uniref:cation:proton antiporter domain-containing protein n=1 Tax=Falsiroseomonas sp. HC035 TaxID=3390999 RepID=UPI003D3216FB